VYFYLVPSSFVRKKGVNLINFTIHSSQDHCQRAFPAPRVATVCDLLQLAELHGADRLKERATAFIKANVAAVIKTAGWCDLCRNDPKFVGALLVVTSAV
jgi:hypothetical protein